MIPDSQVRSRRLGAILGAAIAAIAMAAAAEAQGSECEPARDVAARALSEFTHRQLNRVYEAVAEEKYDQAFEDLDRMLGRAGKDEYLAAILNQALAQVEWSREHYDSALGYIETAIELDVLPNDTHFGLMYQLAQLYYMNERYPEALDRLELWLCAAPPETVAPAAYVLQASIHSAMEQYPQALQSIETAIAMEPQPKEQWYQLKLGVLYELGRFPRVAETLESMVAHWPQKKAYWVQLSQAYFRLERADRALSVMALAHRNGLLNKDSEIAYLSSLYSNGGVPYKAAEVLQSAIEDGMVESNRSNWMRVAEEWYNAAELEKSLIAYERAGQASADGEIDLRRGYLLVDLERWPEAKKALDSAIAKEGVEERKLGEAYLLRGMAKFNLGDFDGASADWGRASRFEQTQTAAEQWIALLREERRRQDL